jgi:type II secretory ATPase GspE/PulE/Tfp pilus assembly ATPase PilB-like protein
MQMATNPVAPMGAPAEFKARLVDVINKIHAAPTTRDILVGLKDEIQALLNAERMTIYALDTQNQQLYSITAVGGEVKEIRVPKNYSSIAGFTGLSRQTVNIKDAYDATELARINPKLTFDARWDKATKFRTKQVLCAPILFDKFLLGVVQLVNRKGPGAFTPDEVAALEEVAKTLGIAFYNQRRVQRTGKPTKYGHLIDKGVVSEQNLEIAASEARVKNCSVEQVLIERFKVPKPEILKSLSQFFAVTPWEWTEAAAIPEDLKPRVNVDFLRKARWAPVGRTPKELMVAVEDPHDLTKIDSIKATNLAPRIDFQVAIWEDVKKVIDKAFGVEADDTDDTLGEVDTDDLEMDEDASEEDGVTEQDNAVVKLANTIIRDAYKSGASDIHVEPYGDKVPTVVRFRADGDCAVYKEVPPELRNALVSRLKIMARLDISEKRKPQDGKIRFKSKKGPALELRVATIPTAGGNEDVVMRILAGSEPLPLEKMGFSERNLREFKALLAKPYGICLVVGPTGSGKTTTLHSGLGSINTPDMKIWTAEDPVEITQKGLRQVQMHSKIGLTFASAMRAFLRADPDVIMVGEMRDQETAQTGIEASLTGHLVFSTLHTNSAAETITRLLDMDIDPFSFADALLGIMAQRLVRSLCKTCKEAYHPEQDEYAELVKSYGEKWWSRVNVPYSADLALYRPKGCPECANTGLRGRMAIHELLVSTDTIKDMIQTKAPVSQIHEESMKGGMETLMQDGIAKVFKGLTSFQQIKMACMK